MNKLNSMAEIRFALDRDLLKAADEAATRLKMSRSALVQEALREHLKRMEEREREALDRQGFVRYPDSLDRFAAWDDAADWAND